MLAAVNHREKKFVAAYDGVMSGADACLLAGYRGTPKSRRTEASRLLAKADVKAAIEAKIGKQAEKLELKAEKILAELARLGFADPGEAFDANGVVLHPKQMPDGIRACLKSFEVEELLSDPDPDGGERFKIGRVVKVSFWDKPKGLELLGKNKGLFPNKVELGVESKTLEQLITGSFGGED